MFSDHDETSPSIAAVSAPSVACSMLAVQQQKRLCRQSVDVSAARRGCHSMKRLTFRAILVVRCHTTPPRCVRNIDSRDATNAVRASLCLSDGGDSAQFVLPYDTLRCLLQACLTSFVRTPFPPLRVTSSHIVSAIAATSLLVSTIHHRHRRHHHHHQFITGQHCLHNYSYVYSYVYKLHKTMVEKSK